MGVRKEVVPFLIAADILGILLAVGLHLAGAGLYVALGLGIAVMFVVSAYMLYFFRDPPRQAPNDPTVVVASADGVVARIVDVREDKYLKTDTVRLSIFLSLMNVHVNRSPIAGKTKFLGYFPGKRLFTFDEKSSDVNQHNAILLTGQGIQCLVNQIVGPVCRRVVYWPSHTEEADIAQGEPIGMMKFGSRLDMYFPKGSVELQVKVGDIVRAGESVVARIVKKR